MAPVDDINDLLIDLLDDLSNNLKESLNTLNINNIKS
jgi:hypothetical protein